jgi:hypothetical protein
MRLEKVIKLGPHLASQCGPRMVVRAVGVDQVTACPVNHVVVHGVGKEPGLPDELKFGKKIKGSKSFVLSC